MCIKDSKHFPYGEICRRMFARLNLLPEQKRVKRLDIRNLILRYLRRHIFAGCSVGIFLIMLICSYCIDIR